MLKEDFKTFNKSPFFFFKNDRDAEKIIFDLQVNEKSGSVKVIRGWKCTTKTELLSEAGAALQFPQYFGENWDAFDECICDLSWLPAEWYLIWIPRIEEVLKENEKELEIFLSVLVDAIEYWTNNSKIKNVPFNVVFSGEQATIEEFKKIIKRLSKKKDNL